jgi:hypothetical protein
MSTIMTVVIVSAVAIVLPTIVPAAAVVVFRSSLPLCTCMRTTLTATVFVIVSVSLTRSVER